MSHFRRRPELQSSLNVNQKNLFPDHLEICHEIWDQLEASASKNRVSGGVLIAENAFAMITHLCLIKDFTLRTKRRWHSFGSVKERLRFERELTWHAGAARSFASFLQTASDLVPLFMVSSLRRCLERWVPGLFQKEPCERVHEVQTLGGMLSSGSGIQEKGKQIYSDEGKRLLD